MADVNPVVLEQYDVLHVEDDPVLGMLMDSLSKEKGLSYHRVSSLEGLEILLRSSVARLYVIDGQFPTKQKNSGPRDNAYNAVEMIQRHGNMNGYDPLMVIFSGDDDKEEVAKIYGVDFFHKSNDGPQQVLEKLL